MNRRGFMQTLFGGAVAALLPRSVKAKDVEGGRLLPQDVQDEIISKLPTDTSTSNGLGLPEDFYVKVMAHIKEKHLMMGDACFKMHFFYGIPVNRKMPICYTITND